MAAWLTLVARWYMQFPNLAEIWLATPPMFTSRNLNLKKCPPFRKIENEAKASRLEDNRLSVYGTVRLSADESW